MIEITGSTIVEPTSLTVDIKEIEDTNSSTRMSDGSYSKDVIANKRTLNLNWSALTWSELSTILTALNVDYANITYPDTISGELEIREFFVVNRNSPVAFKQGDIYYWENVSITLEER